MKKLLGILVLGLFLEGCATTEKIISDNKVYKDMSKSDLQNVFIFSYPGDDPFIPGGGSEFFRTKILKYYGVNQRINFMFLKMFQNKNLVGLYYAKLEMEL